MQLIGEYETILNQNFEFEVPEFLLKQFSRLTLTSFYINKGFERCLTMYSEELWLRSCHNLFFDLNHDKEVIRDYLSYFFESSVFSKLVYEKKIKFDNELFEFLGKPRNLVLFAMNDRVEIWSRSTYDKMIGSEIADFTNLASEVLGKNDNETAQKYFLNDSPKISEKFDSPQFPTFDSDKLSRALENVIFEKNLTFREPLGNFKLNYKNIFIPSSFFDLYGDDTFITLNKIMYRRSVKINHSNKVFLCHSSKDKSFVKNLALELRKNKIDVWLDEWEMLPGDSLINKIQNGIDESSWFGVILSPNSVSSRWCTKELNTAISKELEKNNVFVIPILKEKCELPLFLQEKMYADLTPENYQKGFNLLLKRLKN